MEQVITSAASIMPKLISENGVSACVFAIFFIIFLVMMFYFVKRTAGIDEFLMEKKKRQAEGGKESDWNAQTEQRLGKIEKCIGEIDCKLMDIEKAFKDLRDSEKLKKQEKSALPDRQLNIGTKTDTLLHEYMDKLKADRMDVFIFSNGKVSTSGGFDFLHFNHSFQFLRKGGVSKALKEAPFTFLSSFFSALNRHGVLIIDSDKKTQKYGPTFTQWVDETGTESIAFAMLKVDSDLAGFVAASYDSGSVVSMDEKRLSLEMKMLVAKMEVTLAK